MPRDLQMRLYFQYVQKNRADLNALRDSLVSVGIKCGVLHNPSRRVDPDYWRFFIAAASHVDFMTQVGSWHPAKEPLIAERLSWSGRVSENIPQFFVVGDARNRIRDGSAERPGQGFICSISKATR